MQWSIFGGVLRRFRSGMVRGYPARTSACFGSRLGSLHGFLVSSQDAHVMYKTTDYYAPQHERTLRWDDAALGIDWPLKGPPIVSEKDERGSTLQTAEVFK